jgi:hypothetical protein
MATASVYPATAPETTQQPTTDLHKSAAATQQQATREKKSHGHIGLFTQTPTQVHPLSSSRNGSVRTALPLATGYELDYHCGDEIH